jgi:hypothetical protein
VQKRAHATIEERGSTKTPRIRFTQGPSSSSFKTIHARRYRIESTVHQCPPIGQLCAGRCRRAAKLAATPADSLGSEPRGPPSTGRPAGAPAPWPGWALDTPLIPVHRDWQTPSARM